MLTITTSPKDIRLPRSDRNTQEGLSLLKGKWVNKWTVLSFSDLIPGSNAKAYNENGYCLFGCSLYCSGAGLPSTVKGVYSGVSSKNLTLKRLDGKCFDLISLDLSNLNAQLDSQYCTIKGSLVNGTKVFHTLCTSSMTFGYQSYVLPSSFKGLLSVELGSGLVITSQVVLR